MEEAWEDDEEQEETFSDSDEVKDHESCPNILSSVEGGGSLDDSTIFPTTPASKPFVEEPTSSSPSSTANVLKSSNSFMERVNKKSTPRQKDPKNSKRKQAALEIAAVKIQAAVRRWRTIKYVRAFRQQAIVSSTLLQKIIRGFCARIRVKSALLRKRASIAIQKRARGMITRVRSFIFLVPYAPT